MYRHVGQLVIISERFTQVKNWHVSISNYFSSGHELSSCRHIGTTFCSYSEMDTLARRPEFTIEQSLYCNMCQNAKLFITSAHQQPIPFCIIMKRIHNIKKKHFQILKQHIKYSTCSVYVFFRNIHISPYNKLIQRSKFYHDPTFTMYSCGSNDNNAHK